MKTETAMKKVKTNYGDLPLAIDAQGRARLVRGGVDARHASAKKSASSCEAAIQQTKSRRGESAPSPSAPYRSKWEAAYAQQLDLEKAAGVIKAWWYEPMTFTLPGGVRYKPDFLVQYSDGLERRLEFHEVKGTWIKNRRDGVTRFKLAAGLFPCFVWRLVERDGSAFVTKAP